MLEDFENEFETPPECFGDIFLVKLNFVCQFLCCHLFHCLSNTTNSSLKAYGLIMLLSYIIHFFHTTADITAKLA